MSVLIFFRVSVRSAVLLIFIGGWLLLPVGNFPTEKFVSAIPWWITGLAMPSDMLITKAWIAPAAAFAGASVFDFRTLRSWRPTYIDLPMALWCLWPIFDSLLTPLSDPSPWAASLYVAGCWGLPWLLGRIWFDDQEGRMILIKALSYGGLACLPFAIVEGIKPPAIYDIFFGPHPFRLDGTSRYVGYRPLGFFEHGNQYGIWTSISAFASIWLFVARRRTRNSQVFLAIAVITTMIAIASQSVGAIILLFSGLVLLLLWRYPATKVFLVALIVLIALTGAMHLSGIIPLKEFALDTALGQQTLQFFRMLGRSSFLWRLSQDIKVLEIIHETPLLGTTIWDWWHPFHTRPWGLALLLIGQFGLIGFALSFGSLLYVACSAQLRVLNLSCWSVEAVVSPLAFIILLSLADALLNSFFYFPAILVAGAIAASHHRVQGN